MDPNQFVEAENQLPRKENFLERNMQIFELGFFLALIFIILTTISVFLPKTRPQLVPTNEPETTDTLNIIGN